MVLVARFGIERS